MRFVKQSEQYKEESKNDKVLLRFSNYLFYNNNAVKKSPHYKEIVRKINEIEMNTDDGAVSFLTIARKSRRLVDDSPALSQLSLKTKAALMSLVKAYSEEIFQGSRPPSKQLSDDFDIAADSMSIMSEEEEHTDPELSSSDLTEESFSSSGPASASGSTIETSFNLDSSAPTDDSGITDKEMAEMAYIPTRTVKINLSASERASPSEAARNNAIILLARYIRTDSPDARLARTEIILKTDRALLSKLQSGQPEEVKLSKEQSFALFTIAIKYKAKLNEFQERLEEQKQESQGLNRF